MITREVENAIKAMPSFITAVLQTQNPVSSIDNLITNRKYWIPEFEDIAKAVWVILPFQFAALVSFSKLTAGQVSGIILISFVTLFAISWLGTFVSMLHGVFVRRFLRRNNTLSNEVEDPKFKYQLLSSWVSYLFRFWFIANVLLAVITLYLWIRSKEGKLVDISSEFDFTWCNLIICEKFFLTSVAATFPTFVGSILIDHYRASKIEGESLNLKSKILVPLLACIICTFLLIANFVIDTD